MLLGSTGVSGCVVPNLLKSRPSPTIYLNESAGGQRQSLRVLIQTNLQYLPQVKEPSPTLIEKEEITDCGDENKASLLVDGEQRERSPRNFLLFY